MGAVESRPSQAALAAVALLVTRHLLVVEVAGVVMLALTGWLQLRRPAA